MGDRAIVSATPRLQPIGRDPMKRLEAIDREARRLVNEFAVNRQATLVTQERADDPTFRHDVIARVRQILAGDDLPITHLNPDD